MKEIVINVVDIFLIWVVFRCGKILIVVWVMNFFWKSIFFWYIWVVIMCILLLLIVKCLVFRFFIVWFFLKIWEKIFFFLGLFNWIINVFLFMLNVFIWRIFILYFDCVSGVYSYMGVGGFGLGGLFWYIVLGLGNCRFVVFYKVCVFILELFNLDFGFWFVGVLLWWSKCLRKCVFVWL